MNILAMDTSGPVAGVAILHDDAIVYEACAMNKFTHSTSMMPMVEEAFIHTGLSIGDMDRLAVVTGPGSFTGVRIGVSTVKGLSHGSGIPCVAVDALEALAAGIPYFDGIICPIQDARAGQVYSAAFRPNGVQPIRLMEDQAIKLTEYLESLQALGDRFLFLGDGLAVHREGITKVLGERAVLAAAPNAYLRPSVIASLAATREPVDYLTLAPMYLRAPQAQRERERREAEKRNGDK